MTKLKLGALADDKPVRAFSDQVDTYPWWVR